MATRRKQRFDTEDARRVFAEIARDKTLTAKLARAIEADEWAEAKGIALELEASHAAAREPELSELMRALHTLAGDLLDQTDTYVPPDDDAEDDDAEELEDDDAEELEDDDLSLTIDPADAGEWDDEPIASDGGEAQRQQRLRWMGR